MNGRPTCTRISKNGSPCRAPVQTGDTRCWAHSERAVEGRRLGGRNSANRVRALKHLPPVLSSLQTTLLDMIAGVRDGTTKPRELEAVSAAAARLIDLAKFALEAGETHAVTDKLAAMRAEIDALLRHEAAG